MSGSLTYRAYTSDAGVSYTIKIDESNAQARVVGGAANDLVPVRTANLPIIPQGLRKRYVNTVNAANSSQKRRFYVGTAAAYLQASAPGASLTTDEFLAVGNATSGTVTWNVTSISGEKARVAPSFAAADTGLIDGDATQ